jgi:hypothetical protein
MTTAYYFLPRGLVPVTIERKCEKDKAGKTLQVTEQMTIGATYYTPDTDIGGFVLVYDPDIFSDDTLSIETTSGGLLKSVNAVADDKTATVVQKVVELAKEIALAAAGFAEETRPPCMAFKLTQYVDPSCIRSSVEAGAAPTDAKPRSDTPTCPNASKEEERINKALKELAHPMRFEIDFENVDGASSNNIRRQDYSSENSSHECNKTVCFRPLLPYRLRLYKTEEGWRRLRGCNCPFAERSPHIGDRHTTQTIHCKRNQAYFFGRDLD